MNKRQVKHTRPVNSAQVHETLESVLTSYLSLNIAGRDLDESMLWDILITPSVQQTTIEAVCTKLEGAPSGNTVREHLGSAVGQSPAAVVLPLDTVDNSLRVFDSSNWVSSLIFFVLFHLMTWDDTTLTQVAR